MKKIVAIVGPTATGKTDISISIAKRYNCEIISGDSTQVYKRLNIGTAKIKEEETENIKHHFIDIVEPNENYDVKTYQRDVREKIKDIDKPLIVGGTGLYIKAVLDDYDFSGDGRSSSFEQEHEHLSNEELYQLLVKANIEASKKTHPNNRRRVLRALQLNNVVIKNKKNKPYYKYLIIYLTMPRKQLYERINLRADIMFKEGLLEEVIELRNDNIKPNIINYKQLNQYLDGNITLDEAKEMLKRDTRRYAKRQITWFNNQMSTIKVDISDKNKAEKEIFEALDKFWG